MLTRTISWKKFSVFNIACVRRRFSIFLDKNCHFVSLHLITCEFLINSFIYSLAVVVHKWSISHHIHEYVAHLVSVHACIPLALVQWWSEIDITINSNRFHVRDWNQTSDKSRPQGCPRSRQMPQALVCSIKRLTPPPPPFPSRASKTRPDPPQFSVEGYEWDWLMYYTFVLGLQLLTVVGRGYIFAVWAGVPQPLPLPTTVQFVSRMREIRYAIRKQN